jgi:hypothetical protein
MATRRIVQLAVSALAFTVGMSAVRAVVEAQGERVPEAAVVSGAPQGLFVGRSLLTGRAVCLLFLSGGRITRAIPEGGLERFDWGRHQAAHPGDSGSWEMRGGQLVVAWGDGGVHQGPLSVHPGSIEFYGKRYAVPTPVGIAAIAGRWESARGTAIAGGAGIITVSELDIRADGRYQWGATTGGVVSGRAVVADRSMSGHVSVTGLTMTFSSDAGASTSHTFLPVADQPVVAFGLDSNMFTRTGPAPAGPEAHAAGAPLGTPAASALPGSRYHGVEFALPTGWTSGQQQGSFLLGPIDATPDTAVVVVLSGAEPLAGRALDAWLALRMASDLGPGVRALQTAPSQRGLAGALDTVSAGRTIQDENAAVRLQIYHAVSDGQQVAVAMVVATSEAALTKYMRDVQSVIESLRFSGTP